MDIMATHPTKQHDHSKHQAESSDVKSLLGILIGMIIWAILVLIATW